MIEEVQLPNDLLEKWKQIVLFDLKKMSRTPNDLLEKWKQIVAFDLKKQMSHTPPQQFSVGEHVFVYINGECKPGTIVQITEEFSINNEKVYLIELDENKHRHERLYHTLYAENIRANSFVSPENYEYKRLKMFIAASKSIEQE